MAITVEALNELGQWIPLSNVLSVAVRRGMTDGEERVAEPGEATVVVDNASGSHSPASDGTYGVPVAVGQTVRVKHDSVVEFTGAVTHITPAPGAFGERTVTIQASDLLGLLQVRRVSMPVFEGVALDEAVRRVVATAMRQRAASRAILVNSLPAEGDTVGIGGQVYTFRTTPTAAYEVARGSSGTQTAAQSLTAAINEDAQTGGYGTGTRRHPLVTAEYLPGGSGGTTVYTRDESDLEPGPTWEYVYKQLLGGSAERWLAQRWTPASGGELLSVEMYIYYPPVITRPGTGITARLRAEIYTEAANGLPGTKLAEKLITRSWSYPQTGEWSGWELWPFDMPVNVSANTTYWVVLRPLAPILSGDWQLSDWYAEWDGTDNASDVWGMAVYQSGDGWRFIGGTPSSRMKVTFGEPAISRVLITAVCPGLWGDGITLVKTGTAITLTGGALFGGQDYSGLTTDSSQIVLSRFAPRADDATVSSLLRGLVDTEYGVLYCGKDNTLQFRNRLWRAYRVTTDPVLTLSEYTSLDVRGAGDRMLNRISIQYTPHRVLGEGVLAQSDTSIPVPGRGTGAGSYERWNLSTPPANAQGSKTITLRYTDVAGGRLVGRQVYTPVPGTDYTVTDAPDGSGYNYTNTGRVRLSTALASSGVEVTLTNTAMGTLYVHALRVRGVGDVVYDQQQAMLEDTLSQELYGVYDAQYALAHEIVSASVYAESVARHLLARHSIPRVAVERVTVDPRAVPTIWSVDIGDLIQIEDAIVGTRRALVMGVEWSAEAGRPQTVTLVLYDTHGRTYWRVGHATYGKLGKTTRLAI